MIPRPFQLSPVKPTSTYLRAGKCSLVFQKHSCSKGIHSSIRSHSNQALSNPKTHFSPSSPQCGNHLPDTPGKKMRHPIVGGFAVSHAYLKIHLCCNHDIKCCISQSISSRSQLNPPWLARVQGGFYIKFGWTQTDFQFLYDSRILSEFNFVTICKTLPQGLNSYTDIIHPQDKIQSSSFWEWFILRQSFKSNGMI
jgi:hypothetical protein